MEELKITPGLDRNVQARVKINLGDCYLMNGDIWESTLLYSQVDKDFKEEPIGQEARFKNARLSYFNGDFQWAQAQFDVLKASTSKLIANDALDLSVFIMDNLNLDTTAAAISLYSGAELLVFQNRFDEAFLKAGYPAPQFSGTLVAGRYSVSGSADLREKTRLPKSGGGVPGSSRKIQGRNPRRQCIVCPGAAVRVQSG